MNIEENRLNTFRDWPSSAEVEPIRIAKAGFFYTGQGLEVECFSCGGTISDWNYGDQVMQRHRQLFPNCSFVQDPDTSNNVSLILNPDSPARPSRSINNFNGMNFEENRLNSFREWPSAAQVQPLVIAKAGFYYTGENLTVRCFSCGCQISEWHHGIDILLLHRQISPNCIFIWSPEAASNVSLMPEVSIDNNFQQSSNGPNIDNGNETLEFANYGVTDEDRMYRNYALRLLSFVNWPQDIAITPNVVAESGLYHVGGGELRCAWCAGILRQSSIGDNAVRAHALSYPNCCRSGLYDSQALSSGSTNVDGNLFTDGVAYNENILENNTWRTLGIISGAETARHPQRSTLETRLETFTNWPNDRAQLPKDLAEAGFFFTGLEDRVRCFYCDGGLGSWERTDVPWREHARWFPHCGYVLLIKGRDYVKNCKDPSLKKANKSRSRRPFRPVSPTDSQVEEMMNSPVVIDALSLGLDAARVRATVVRRLRHSRNGFSTTESLLDAVLQQQLDEETWSARPSPLALLDNIEMALERIGTNDNESSSAAVCGGSGQAGQDDDQDDQSDQEDDQPGQMDDHVGQTEQVKVFNGRPLSLEDENRQLKEARLCKVCMDREVGVVFLPCGHLVSCPSCGTSLHNCPLCRASVRALVRAYLA